MDDFYTVSHFLDEKQGRILVHWKGYDDPDDFTWEPKENLLKDLGERIFNLFSGSVGNGKRPIDSFLDEKGDHIKVKWENKKEGTWEPASRLRYDLGIRAYASFVGTMVNKMAKKLKNEVEGKNN